MDVDVSVVIPAFNAEKFILDCLKSVLCADISGMQLEIIVVDDASTDRTADLVTGFAGISTVPLNLIQLERNGGAGLARRRGLELCRGEFIACVDADDLVPSSRFKDQITLLRNDRSVILCGGDVIEFADADGVRSRAINFPVEHEDIVADMLFYCPIWAGTAMFRSILLEKISYPAVRVGEDWLFLLRAASHGRLAGCGTPVIYCRRHSMQATASPNASSADVLPVWETIIRSIGIDASPEELRLHALCSPYIRTDPCSIPEFRSSVTATAWAEWSKKLIGAPAAHSKSISDRCKRISQVLNSCSHLDENTGEIRRIF